MEAPELPPAVAFDLRAREAREIRDAVFPNAKQTWVVALGFAMGMANGGLRLSSHGAHDALGWAFIGSYLVLGAISLERFRRFFEFKPESDIDVAFSHREMRVVRGARTDSFAYARIARVRILPNVIVVEPKRLRPLAIPRRVLPEDGAQLTKFFENRLIGKRLLRRPASSTLILNTAKP